MRQTSLIDTIWLPVKDGNDAGREIFDNHYSRRHYRGGPRSLLYGGPGERMVLITPDALALFIWRKFFSTRPSAGELRLFPQRGLSAGRSSELILAAMDVAWERWPQETRLYTYVNPRRVRISAIRGGASCGWAGRTPGRPRAAC